jgi:hypothetical protein
MSETPPSENLPQASCAARCYGIRDRMLLGLVLVTIVSTGEALAGEQAVIVNPTSDLELGKLRQSAPPAAMLTDSQLYTAPPLKDNALFSNTDFTPRKHTVFDTDPAVDTFGDTPMLRGTTVWQRLSEYKSHDRVRLLTLWESSGSSVSLQAGRRGDPSLQWTSRLMNHGGSTQGLLDRWFSVSLARASNGLRTVAHATSTSLPMSKTTNAPVTADLK